MTAVKHTFLFREGIWKLEGDYTDLHNHICPMVGETRIIHDSGRFISESEFILHFEHPSLFYHKVEMPEILTNDLTIWKSLELISGVMQGRAYILSDHIIFVYQSENGVFSGVENIVRINDVYYQNTGSLFRLEEKLASWKSEMLRIA